MNVPWNAYRRCFEHFLGVPSKSAITQEPEIVAVSATCPTARLECSKINCEGMKHLNHEGACKARYFEKAPHK